MKKQIHVSWLQIDGYAKQLADEVKGSGRQFDAVYGIPRGGLPIAVILSHQLDIPLVMDVEDLERDSRLLVVDDISDEGKTLIDFEEDWLAMGYDVVFDFETATIHTTPWTKYQPTFSVAIKDDKESWLVYPWETMSEGVE